MQRHTISNFKRNKFINRSCSNENTDLTDSYRLFGWKISWIMDKQVNISEQKIRLNIFWQFHYQIAALQIVERLHSIVKITEINSLFRKIFNFSWAFDENVAMRYSSKKSSRTNLPVWKNSIQVFPHQYRIMPCRTIFLKTQIISIWEHQILIWY